jgi:hypothetical protein
VVSLWRVADALVDGVEQPGGDTALHFAACGGHLSLVQMLVERAPQLLELTNRVSGKMVLRACVMCE